MSENRDRLLTTELRPLTSTARHTNDTMACNNQERRSINYYYRPDSCEIKTMHENIFKSDLNYGTERDL